MKTLQLTETQVDEILHCLRTSYLDYNDRMGAAFNDAIKRSNDNLDNIIQTIKDQIKEQENSKFGNLE